MSSNEELSDSSWETVSEHSAHPSNRPKGFGTSVESSCDSDFNDQDEEDVDSSEQDSSESNSDSDNTSEDDRDSNDEDDSDSEACDSDEEDLNEIFSRIFLSIYDLTHFGCPEALEAIRTNDCQAMKRLIDEGFDVNKSNTYCLFGAISEGNFDMVKMLFDAGANRDCVDSYKIGPLNEAILISDTSKRWAMVRLLIDCGVSVKNDEHLRDSFVHEAVRQGDVEMVKFLSDAGASLNRLNFDGDAPIHVALFNLQGEVRLKMVKQLIEIGADVNIKGTKAGFTCLHWLVGLQSDKRELTKLFLDAGAQLNCVSNNGETPLAWATIAQDYELMQLMVDAGADVNFPKVLHKLPLSLAVMNNYKDAVELLLKCGANPSMKDADSDIDTLICAATQRNKSREVPAYIEILKMHLNHSAYKDRSKEEKSMIFESVLEMGTIESVRVFIENGVSLRECGVSYPLHKAARNRKVEILEYLLKSYMFNVDEADKSGHTALMVAIENKNSACVKLLLEWGADVEKSMTIADMNVVLSPLCLAVLEKNRNILDLLMSVGANPNPNYGNDDDRKIFVNTRPRNRINACLNAQSVLLSSSLGWAKMDPEYKWLRMTYCSEAVDQCLAEHESLKSTILHGSVTFYDFLKGIDVTGFVYNSDVIDRFKSMNVTEKFPIYCRQIDLRYSMACVKKSVMDEAAKGLGKILGANFHDCYLILHNIMLQLHMKDLRNLCNV